MRSLSVRILLSNSLSSEIAGVMGSSVPVFVSSVITPLSGATTAGVSSEGSGVRMSYSSVNPDSCSTVSSGRRNSAGADTSILGI